MGETEKGGNGETGRRTCSFGTKPFDKLRAGGDAETRLIKKSFLV